MTLDTAAVQRLVADVTLQFQDGLQKLVAAASLEAEIECKRLADETLALSQEKARLEQAVQHLRLEKLRLEVTPMAPELQDVSTLTVKEPELGTPTFQARGLLKMSPADIGFTKLQMSDHVPTDFAVTSGGSTFAVLPAECPDSSQLGHDHWNQTVVVPDGWEVVTAEHRDFKQAVAAMTQYRWGAMVLGVRNTGGGFDAYYTPLFQAGNYQGKLCQADVDWIEPVAGNPNGYRMTYSGLRLLVRARTNTGRSPTVMASAAACRRGP